MTFLNLKKQAVQAAGQTIPDATPPVGKYFFWVIFFLSNNVLIQGTIT